MANYISLMRPYQWSKNIFILAPAFFGFGQYAFGMVWANLILTLIAFCVLSSGMYVLNDIIDAKLDSLHPTKRFRPIPSGKINKFNALILSLLLVSIAFLTLLAIMGGGKYP